MDKRRHMTFNKSVDKHIREAQKILMGCGVKRKYATKERALELIVNMNKATNLSIMRKRKSKDKLIIEL